MKHNWDVITVGNEEVFSKIRKRLEDNPRFCACGVKISPFEIICLDCYWKGIRLEREQHKLTKAWSDYYAGNGEKPF